ncbi:MAG: hypothetical protein QM726_17050 [Chitinophagaceae bacterium]
MEKISKISLAVNFDQQPREDISLIGFLFYCNGIFLQRQPVVKNMLVFNLADTAGVANRQTAIDPKELKIFIAPAADKKIEQVTTIEALEAYKAYEPVLSTDRQGNFSILPIPNVIAQFWPFCNCRVTGKVSKWFHFGDTWSDRPVCRARVHICEVDSIWYWIYRIPDNIIAKIPEIILRPKEIIKFPIPIPDPPPFALSAISQPVQQATNIFKTVSAEQQQMEAAASLPEISMDIRQKLASNNLNVVRETIAANYAILHPWFCLWPWWWPYFYRCTEKKVVYTDASGRFDTNISYWCADKPDIYIWVEYLIGGVWTTVYAPPIPCYTNWDYACGTNINIHITDPRVPVDCCCNCPLPGDLVFIRSIGSTSVSHINQNSFLQTPPGQSVAYNRIGLTDAAAIYDGFFATTVGDYKRPFGGGLSFYMGFGSNLPSSNISYYRWRYKKTANADLSAVSGSVEQIDTLELKAYDFTYIDSNGDEQIGHNSVKLGPFTVGPNNNLYKIPPSSPAMAPFNVPETNPQWYERTHNTHTIGFDSSALKNASMNGGDGLYEFTLELFDSAGNLLTNIAKTIFKTPDYNDADTSVNAPDQLLAGVTATTANAFKMLVRIDNSVCNSQVFTVNVNGMPASSDCCGFVNYKPGGVEADLDLSFLATHPNNFAVFSFGVNKGTCGDVAIADASGMVIDSASGYTLSGGIYDKHFTPSQLLGSCYLDGTGKGAFAETLSVIAMATDGTFRQTGKDAPYRVAAFALEP